MALPSTRRGVAQSEVDWQGKISKLESLYNDGYASKNLIDGRGLVEQTLNGVTFTPVYNSNGLLDYINVNGTNNTNSSSYYYVARNIGKKGRITLLSGCPSGGSTNSTNAYVLQLYAQGVAGSYADDTGKSNIRIDDVTLTDAVITIRPNTVCDNLKFYPMLRDANYSNPEYSPYVPSNIVLNDLIKKIGEKTPISITPANGVSLLQNHSYIINGVANIRCQLQVTTPIAKDSLLFSIDKPIQDYFSGFLVDTNRDELIPIFGTYVTVQNKKNGELSNGFYVCNITCVVE